MTTTSSPRSSSLPSRLRLLKQLRRRPGRARARAKRGRHLLPQVLPQALLLVQLLLPRAPLRRRQQHSSRPSRSPSLSPSPSRRRNLPSRARLLLRREALLRSRKVSPNHLPHRREAPRRAQSIVASLPSRSPIVILNAVHLTRAVRRFRRRSKNP